jgi:hypothetical protein
MRAVRRRKAARSFPDRIRRRCRTGEIGTWS